MSEMVLHAQSGLSGRCEYDPDNLDCAGHKEREKNALLLFAPRNPLCQDRFRNGHPGMTLAERRAAQDAEMNRLARAAGSAVASLPNAEAAATIEASIRRDCPARYRNWRRFREIAWTERARLLATDAVSA